MKSKSRKTGYWIHFWVLNACFPVLLGSFSAEAQVLGCTDRLAINYNSKASQNNGSCVYKDTIVAPAASFDLPQSLQETSGLIFFNDQLLTHNDSDDTKLYAIDPETSTSTKTFDLQGTKNTDWEEITQDENFIYVGDFGNNLHGNRKNLKILRVEKSSLLENKPRIDTINFSYADQTDFAPQPNNQTDYDCEAFFTTGDSIYLLTKQWVSQKSAIYTLPKTPGTYQAQLKTSLDVQGLTTGATFLPEKKLLVLSGYSPSLEPFIYLVYDYQSLDFKMANKRKLRLELPFTQVEGITTRDGLEYYLSNEYFSRPPFVNSPQRLHRFNLNGFLSGYLSGLETQGIQPEKGMELKLSPVPSNNFIAVDNLPEGLSFNYRIAATNGQIVKAGKLNSKSKTIDVGPFQQGTYFLRIDSQKQTLKIVKN